MPCTLRRSVFSKPFKFGNDPVYTHVINFETGNIESVEITSGYIQLNACLHPLELVFLNRLGGLDSFTFTGKHQDYDEISASVVYQDASAREMLADRGIIRERVTVQSQYLAAQWVKELREIYRSLRIWAYIDGEYKDVRIVEGTFPTGMRGENIQKVTFDILIGKLIQTQTA